MVSSRAFVLTFAHCHFDAWRRAFSDDGKKAEDSATLFERESRAVLASVPQAEESPAAFYARRVLLPAGPEDCEEFDAAQSKLPVSDSNSVTLSRTAPFRVSRGQGTTTACS